MQIIRIVIFLIFFLNLSAHVHGQKTLSLRESLQLAKKQNPDLKVLRYNINAAEADVNSAKIRPNPILNVQTLHIANASNRPERTSWSSPLNSQYWYQLTKPLQLPAQRANKINFSQRLVTQSKLDVQESGRKIYLTAANKWLDVWAADINLNILLKGKAYIDSLVSINELRLRDKVITTTDLERTQLLQQQYQRNIVTANQIYRNEIQNLKYLLGTSDSLMIDLQDEAFSSVNSRAIA